MKNMGEILKAPFIPNRPKIFTFLTSHWIKSKLNKLTKAKQRRIESLKRQKPRASISKKIRINKMNLIQSVQAMVQGGIMLLAST